MDKVKRYALIRRIARKLDRQRIRRYHKNLEIIRKAEQDDDQSMIHWGDSQEYAKAHYGEIAHYTLKFESEN